MNERVTALSEPGAGGTRVESRGVKCPFLYAPAYRLKTQLCREGRLTWLHLGSVKPADIMKALLCWTSLNPVPLWSGISSIMWPNNNWIQWIMRFSISESVSPLMAQTCQGCERAVHAAWHIVSTHGSSTVETWESLLEKTLHSGRGASSAQGHGKGLIQLWPWINATVQKLRSDATANACHHQS